VEADVRLLRSRGHRVIEYRRHNEEVESYGRLTVGTRTVWSREAYRSLAALLERTRPDVVHVHNTLPLISPAALWAAKRSAAAVVMTLHNYRLGCTNGLFFRQGHICRDCLAWPGPLQAVIHRCYRSSRMASSAVAAMLYFHRAIGTWRRTVDRFLVLSEFQRRQIEAVGLPAKKLRLRPNFIGTDPGPGSGTRGNALFVGRLSPEKGVGTLLEAWRGLRGAHPLRVVGDGPLAGELRAAAERDKTIEFVGRLPPEGVLDEMKQAACLIFPSECFETFGMAIIEAYSVGLPVLAAEIGSAGDLVVDGRTGFHFAPGDAKSLRDAVSKFFARPDGRAAMALACREEYRRRYGADSAYETLVATYEEAKGLHARSWSG